jgi:hypothetical protein
MSDTNDDPLLGLLTDIAEGVAVLAERIDAMEARATAQGTAVNEALETIAEIAMRTYYATRPAKPLPDEVINAAVMDLMIKRWPDDVLVGMPPDEFNELHDLAQLDTEGLRQAIAQMRERIIQNNAARVRRQKSLQILNSALQDRIEAQERNHEPERERDLGRSR